MPQTVTVRLAFDADAGVWYIESSTLQGLHLEGATVEDLSAKIPDAVQDLLEIMAEGDFDVPLEIFAHSSRRVTGHALAA